MMPERVWASIEQVALVDVIAVELLVERFCCLTCFYNVLAKCQQLHVKCLYMVALSCFLPFLSCDTMLHLATKAMWVARWGSTDHEGGNTKDFPPSSSQITCNIELIVATERMTTGKPTPIHQACPS